VNTEDRAHMKELVYDSLVQNLLTIMGTLDLNYDVRTPSKEAATAKEGVRWRLLPAK
jgi:hypothetical protein